MTFREYLESRYMSDSQNQGSGIQELSFDDIPSIPRVITRFRMHQRGEKVRLSLVFEDSSIFVATKCHYEGNLGYFICKEGICCQALGKPRWRVGVPVFVYSKDGNNGDLQSWTFSERMFTQIREIHNSFPLNKHDLGLICEIPEYQRLDIRALNKCLWREWDNASSIIESSHEVKEFIQKTIAQDLSASHIQQALSYTGPVEPVAQPVQPYKAPQKAHVEKKERNVLTPEVPTRRVNWK